MTVDVSNYPRDFQPTDPGGFQPVDPALFLGVHPLLALLFLALVVLLTGAAWREGRRGAAARPDAAEAIWRAIDKACQAAMRANSDALPGQARALRATLDDRLGAVLTLAGDLSRPLKDLDAALEGRIGSDRPDREPDHAPGHDAHPAPVPANVTVVSNSHVVIKDSKVEHEPHEDGHADAARHRPARKPPHEHDDRERDMTGREQADALRAAIAHFNDHWCRRAERIAELRAAARQLSHGSDHGRGGH